MRPQRSARCGYPPSRAEKIASGLARALGDLALGRAQQRKQRAERLGHHGQIDLYLAVCVILSNRDGVFSRSRGRLAALPSMLLVVPRPLASPTIGPVVELTDARVAKAA